MNNELDNIINSRIGFAYPDPGVIVSAPWQVYRYGRLDYVFVDEDVEILPPDFDLNTPAPEGYIYIEVYNLRGGSANMRYSDTNGDSHEIEVSGSFAILQNNLSEAIIYKTTLSDIDGEFTDYNVDLNSLKRSGYIVEDLDTKQDEETGAWINSAVWMKLPEVQHISGNVVKLLLTYSGAVVIAMGDDFDCSTNTHLFINDVETSITSVQRRKANQMEDDPSGPAYFISIPDHKYVEFYSEDGEHFEFVKFGQWSL